MGLGLHGRGGPRSLQGPVHRSQVSGWETLGGGGQRAEIPGRVVNPRRAGRRGEGMILLLGLSRPPGLPPREFFTARIASGEGAWGWLGSLSTSDCGLLGGPHRRTEVQVSGLISEVQAQVPHSQGASSPHSLILSGLWGRSGGQGVQTNQGHSAPTPTPSGTPHTGRGPAVLISP